ncbi:hypothetical protein [Streptomyces sp. NPDC059783]|uniref:hypothetical protein n=1 Tax=Streptomyces sp. NPDC059783 TaxID=3346944 RepID=UPI003661FD18
MTTETTRPEQTGTLADLAAAVEALAHLQATYPTLPALHVSLLHTGTSLDLQAGTPGAYEVWRAALGIPPTAVEIRSYYESAWLHSATRVQGVATILTGHGLPITGEQAREDQDPADAPRVEELPLADAIGGAA